MHINIRKANRNDVVAIVRLLAEDVMGSERETYNNVLPAQYYSAFDEINADINSHLVQLTTNKERPDALMFYKKLGFVASHEGMKLYL